MDKCCQPLYECKECGHQHPPDARGPHDFLLGTTVCPECGGTRAKVVRDYDGPVGDAEIKEDTQTDGDSEKDILAEFMEKEFGDQDTKEYGAMVVSEIKIMRQPNGIFVAAARSQLSDEYKVLGAGFSEQHALFIAAKEMSAPSIEKSEEMEEISISNMPESDKQ